MEATTYNFEIIAIDRSGDAAITVNESLIHALVFSETLWKSQSIVEKNGSKMIVDEEQKLRVRLQSLDTSEILNEYIEAAFYIQATGEDFDALESFRKKLISHLKLRLRFSNIRILTDDISTTISNRIYPMINNVENLLRRYLVKFFIQKIGVDWWEVTATRNLAEKVKLRKNSEKVFANFIDADVSLIDFDELGELIYKQSSGFNRPEAVVNKIMLIRSTDELRSLKEELQGNYTRFFKETFQDNQFDQKWKMLYEIRNKVAHNYLFAREDLERAEHLCNSLVGIIKSAESKIEEFTFSIDEKEAIRKATIDMMSTSEIQTFSTALDHVGLKVVGRIELPGMGSPVNGYDEHSSGAKVVTDEEILNEIDRAENSLSYGRYKYVGLKSFVTRLLAGKGYDVKSAYSLINIMRDRNIVEIYEIEDPFSGFPVKAIRINR